MGIENLKLQVCNIEAHSGVRRKVFRIGIKLCKAVSVHIYALGMFNERMRGIVEHCALKQNFIVIEA